MVINAAYAGPMSKGMPLIQPLIDAHPIKQNITMVAWNNLLGSAFFGSAPKNAPCIKGQDRSVYAVGIKTYHVPTFDTFLAKLHNFFLQYPAVRSSVFFIEAFPNQAVKLVADDETAYPHRDMNAHLFVFHFSVEQSSPLNDLRPDYSIMDQLILPSLPPSIFLGNKLAMISAPQAVTRIYRSM